MPRTLRKLLPLAAGLAAGACLQAMAQPAPPARAAVPPPPQLQSLPPLAPPATPAPEAAPAATPASAAAQGAARTRGQHPELRVIEDETVRIEETRVRGQLQRVTVHNKLTGRDYEVQVNRGGRDTTQGRNAAGQSGWSLLNF